MVLWCHLVAYFCNYSPPRPPWSLSLVDRCTLIPPVIATLTLGPGMLFPFLHTQTTFLSLFPSFCFTLLFSLHLFLLFPLGHIGLQLAYIIHLTLPPKPFYPPWPTHNQLNLASYKQGGCFNTPEKCSQILYHFHKMQSNILLLQEMHFHSGSIPALRNHYCQLWFHSPTHTLNQKGSPLHSIDLLILKSSLPILMFVVALYFSN